MRLKGYFAVFAAILMAVSSLAVAGGDVSADGTVKATAAIPDPVDYLYTISTDSNNVIINSVCASVNGSELETVYGSANTQPGHISDYWDFDPVTGMGPFNSFYAAVNITEGTGTDNGERQINNKVGTIAFVLDPNDLKKTLMGTEFQGTYNIMLIIPAVYWKSESDVLYLSSSPCYSIGGTTYSGMTAYAHALGDDKEFTNVYPYIGLGVYESSVGDGKLQSVSGAMPQARVDCDTFKSYADSAVPAENSDYQLWNFYQWTLYKMMSYTVMGTKNSKALLGDGPVGEGFPLVSGLADASGPYANATSSYSKLLIENSWGSLREFVGDTYLNDRTLYTGNALGGNDLNSGQTSTGVSLPSRVYWIIGTYSSSEFWDLPMSSGSDKINTGDYVRTNTGLCEFDVGGALTYGDQAGVTYAEAVFSFDYKNTYLGARLAYVMADDAMETFPKRIDVLDVNDSYVCSVCGEAGDSVDMNTEKIRFSGVLASSDVGSREARLDVEYLVTLEHGRQAYGDSRSYWSGPTLQIPDREFYSDFDHNFVGWSLDGETVVAEPSIAIGSPVTLTAMWDTSSGICGDGARYTVDEKGVLSIFPSSTDSIGTVYGYRSGEGTPWFGNPVSELVMFSGIGSIGDYAFIDYTTLISVSILDSEISIGEFAFENCPIKTLTLGMKKIGTDFRGIGTLETLVLLDSVESVEDYAFANCTSLASVSIPGSVTLIEDYAFAGCPIESLTLGMDEIGDDFAGIESLENLVLLDTVTWIGNYAFAGCTSLASVSIPGSVTTIGNNAFAGCNSLASIVIPGSVTMIGNTAFVGCSSLSSVSIPDSVTFICDGAFSGCPIIEYTGTYPGIIDDVIIINRETALVDGVQIVVRETVISVSTMATSVAIPDTVTSIGDYAFFDCRLDLIYLPHTLASLGDQAFYGLTFLDEGGRTLAQDTESLRGYAYEGAGDGELKRLPYVFAQDGVRYWISAEGSAVAVGWEGEPSALGIPDEVTYHGKGYAPAAIADGAFAGCPALESISIGGAVASIGSVALDAPMLRSIEVSGDNATYSSIAGVLYDKGAATLLKFPASKQRLAIPDSVTAIADGAFKDAGVALKNAYAGGDITYFRYVSIPGTVVSVGANAFSGSTLEILKLANGTTTIGSKAFAGCSALYYVVFNGTLADVAADAFEGCVFHGEDGSAMAYSNAAMAHHKFTGKASDSLEMYVPSKGVIRVGGVDYRIASSGASKTVAVSGLAAGSDVTDLAIPASIDYLGFEWEVTGIASKAFYGDSSITSVTTAVDVGSKSFANCRSLETVVLDGDVKVGPYAFFGCKSLTAVDLGDVTVLGASAFSGCRSLSAVDLGKVVTVGKHAFYGCALAEADLYSAEAIGYGAFTGNDLVKVVFSSALKSVDPKAFFRYSFYGADGKKLPVVETDLAGKIFQGSSGKLYL